MPVRRSFVVSLVVAAASFSACSTGEPAADDLDRRLCSSADLQGDYIELARGEFTPRDLADLSDDADFRERQFEEAGMLRGRFVFFNQVLPKPPFDPPLSVVCQAVEFATPERAAAYAAGLDTDHPALQVSGIAWLPEGNRTVEDVAPGVHRITVEPSGRRIAVLVAHVAQGKFFTSVYFGSEGSLPEIDSLRELIARVVARVEEESPHR